MTEVEKYLKLKGERGTIHSRLAGIPAEIARLTEELGPLQDSAVRAELEGDRHASNLRGQIEKAKASISALEAEKAEKAHRAKIMGELLSEYRTKAAAELAQVHDKIFRKNVRAFGEAIRAAHKAEAELCKAFGDAQVAFGEIDSFNPLPTWKLQFVRHLNDQSLSKEFVSFLERWTEWGYDVSK